MIEVDGLTLINTLTENKSNGSGSVRKEDSFITLDSIWEFVQRVRIKDLDIIKKTIELNTTIGLEGLTNKYGLQVGKTIIESIRKGILTDDLITHAMALTAGASDARMAGSTLPVMSNSGSGNQGISATLPVVAVGERLQVSNERLIRAVTLSHLIVICIKSKIGRLSALCGATASGTGASCGIAYLLGGGKAEIKAAIQNMQGTKTGMFCDGAKVGCALKLSSCTNAAVLAALMAIEGIAIQATDGIIEGDAEQTIENLGRLANEGTREVNRGICMRLAVLSGKGGTGKTTVAVNLALSWAPYRPTTYVDYDVEEPNGFIFLKPQIRTTSTVHLPYPEINGACTLCGKCSDACQYHALAVVGGQVLVFPELFMAVALAVSFVL